MGLLAATALSLAAAACGTPSAAPPRTALAAGEPASAAQAPQPVSVKLAINKIGAMTNTWVAQQNGIFAKHSLSVEMMEPSKTGDNIAALQARSVDMALQILGSDMVAKKGGFDIVLAAQNETAGTTPPVSTALMVGTNSTAASVKDPAGRKLGTSSPRGHRPSAGRDSTHEAVVRRLLRDRAGGAAARRRHRDRRARRRGELRLHYRHLHRCLLPRLLPAARHGCSGWRRSDDARRRHDVHEQPQPDRCGRRGARLEHGALDRSREGHMAMRKLELGVFRPIGNNGFLISQTAPQYMPSFEMNAASLRPGAWVGLSRSEEACGGGRVKRKEF